MVMTTLLVSLLVVGGAWWLVQQFLAVQADAARDLLEHWSHTHNLRLLHTERRWLATGPFSVTGALDAPTFHVVARTAQGLERTAWVRCGSFPLGVILDPSIEAHWSP